MMNHTTAQRERPKRAFGVPHVYVLAIIEGDNPHVAHRKCHRQQRVLAAERECRVRFRI